MSDRNQARRTTAEVVFGGTDITSSIRPYLLSLTYTDNEEDEADDLQIKLQDRDSIWLEKWLNDAIQAAASSAPAEGAGEAEAKTYKVTPSIGLNVRTGPGTSYGKLGALPYGTEVSVTGISNGWATIQYSGKTAYVSAQYVTVELELGKAISIEEELAAIRKAEEEKAAKEAQGLFVLAGQGEHPFHFGRGIAGQFSLPLWRVHGLLDSGYLRLAKPCLPDLREQQLQHLLFALHVGNRAEAEGKVPVGRDHAAGDGPPVPLFPARGADGRGDAQLRLIDEAGLLEGADFRKRLFNEAGLDDHGLQPGAHFAGLQGQGPGGQGKDGKDKDKKRHKDKGCQTGRPCRPSDSFLCTQRFWCISLRHFPEPRGNAPAGW